MYSNMLILRLLFIFDIIPLCQSCSPKSKYRHNQEMGIKDQEMDIKSTPLIKSINDLEDLITDLNITNHLYDYYAQKRLKNQG